MLKKYRLIEGKVAETPNGDEQVLLFVNPDDNEKKNLITGYSIDEHTLNSALDPDELSRLEFEPNHAAMIFKRPKNYSDEDRLLFKVASIGAFLFKDRLILVISEDVPLFDGKHFSKVNTPSEVLLRLIGRTIFHFLEHLKVINMISSELENKINASMENRYLINMFTLEKSLVYYLNAINSNSVLIDKLKYNAQKINFTPEQIELLDDIIIENNQCYKQSEIYSNILAGLMDARASIVNNNLNVLIKTLNIITIAIMVPTFVVSAFSMNVKMPFDFGPSHPLAFWIIMGLAAASVLGFMLFWKHRKW
jgi:magnesium transporter